MVAKETLSLGHHRAVAAGLRGDATLRVAVIGRQQDPKTLKRH